METLEYDGKGNIRSVNGYGLKLMNAARREADCGDRSFGVLVSVRTEDKWALSVRRPSTESTYRIAITCVGSSRGC